MISFTRFQWPDDIPNRPFKLSSSEERLQPEMTPAGGPGWRGAVRAMTAFQPRFDNYCYWYEPEMNNAAKLLAGMAILWTQWRISTKSTWLSFAAIAKLLVPDKFKGLQVRPAEEKEITVDTKLSVLLCIVPAKHQNALRQGLGNTEVKGSQAWDV